MTDIQTQPQTLTDLGIIIGFDELARKIRTGTKRPDILATASQILNQVANIWNPAIVYRWLRITPARGEVMQTLIHADTDGLSVSLALGHSTCFVDQASHVLVAAYTAGREIEEEAMKATYNQKFLPALILDLIGLLILEKIGEMVKRMAEDAAADRGWKVSPFLSPGSIHGWELEEQLVLCSLLPLQEAGISMRDDGVLTPFKSLSCMIGIGAGYTSATVGTTCQVCSKNRNCVMQITT